MGPKRHWEPGWGCETKRLKKRVYICIHLYIYIYIYTYLYIDLYVCGEEEIPSQTLTHDEIFQNVAVRECGSDFSIFDGHGYGYGYGYVCAPLAGIIGFSFWDFDFSHRERGRKKCVEHIVAVGLRFRRFPVKYFKPRASISNSTPFGFGFWFSGFDSDSDSDSVSASACFVFFSVFWVKHT
uniref:RE47391p n=1 Tax=Drosophila melanogaster TaxID=7227 RepID=Q7JRF2_DROME